jgi:hypothetical protein
VIFRVETSFDEYGTGYTGTHVILDDQLYLIVLFAEIILLSDKLSEFNILRYCNMPVIGHSVVNKATC